MNTTLEAKFEDAKYEAFAWRNTAHDMNKRTLKAEKKLAALQKSHDNLYKSLKDLVFCIRDFQLGDYSPLMDEIFDAEHDLKIGKKYIKNEK